MAKVALAAIKGEHTYASRMPRDLPAAEGSGGSGSLNRSSASTSGTPARGWAARVSSPADPALRALCKDMPLQICDPARSDDRMFHRKRIVRVIALHGRRWSIGTALGGFLMAIQQFHIRAGMIAKEIGCEAWRRHE